MAGQAGRQALRYKTTHMLAMFRLLRSTTTSHIGRNLQPTGFQCLLTIGTQYKAEKHRRHLSNAAATTTPAVGVECRLSEDSRVATISIQNPKKMNTVNSTILSEVTKTCGYLNSNDQLRAVVLTGGPTAEGKSPSFIGGADIKEMHALSSSEGARTFINRIHAACQALRDLPVPVIARVHGFSLGAGLEIMAACDLRVATRSSVFAMPEVKVGIPSVVEAALLPQLIGFGRTRRLLYLAENVSAEEAERWGLVEKVVEDEVELDRSVDEWVTRLRSMGPHAIRSQKRLIQKWESCSIGDAIQYGVDEFAHAFRDGGREPKEFMVSMRG